MPTIKSALLGVLLFLIPLCCRADAVAPDVYVQSITSEVLETVARDEDMQHGDVDKIMRLLEDKAVPHLDLERMSRTTIGRAWESANEAQRALFLEEFHKLVVRTFTMALAQYHGQPVHYLPSSAKPEDKETVVMAEVMQADNDKDVLAFRLESADQSWRVYDVMVEGVSFVKTYTGQFESLLKSGGMDLLNQKLAEKNRQPLAITAGLHKRRG